MSEEDRRHWDRRWAEAGMAPVGDFGAPPAFAGVADLFPTGGQALELACGRGRAAVWLAERGIGVHAVDVSPVAIELATRLAEESGVAHLCRFEVFDLERGVPDGPPADLVLCHLFNDPRLDQAMVERLAPGGLLAVATLSEVGTEPGPHRVPAGELRSRFGHLELLADGEAGGVAWLVGRSQ